MYFITNYYFYFIFFGQKTIARLFLYEFRYNRTYNINVPDRDV